MKVITDRNGQTVPAAVVPVGREAFLASDATAVRWLSGGGVMINARGTVLLIDPVLEGFDMPLTFTPPVAAKDVPRADAVLITHIDGDHCSLQTLRALAGVTGCICAPHYVAEVLRSEGLECRGFGIGETFSAGETQCTLTPVWHNWQSTVPEYAYREWKKEDYCGYLLKTPDGTVWLPGDSRLIDEQLHVGAPDVILLDFSDDSWHIGFEDALRLCAAYPGAALIPIHWGSVSAPEMPPFNADPRRLEKRVPGPQRLRILYPGEAFLMQDHTEDR